MSMRKRYNRLPGFLLGLVAGAGLLSLLAFKPDYFQISKQLDIFAHVFKQVNLYYVDNTEPGELMEEALTEMLAQLDPYTNYIPEEKIEDFRIQQTGSYGGIGATLRRHDSSLVISTVYQDFPADKAGMRPGDVLLAIDGNSTASRSVSEVSDILKGAPGSTVEVAVRRGGKRLSFSFKRAKVHMNSVPYSGFLKPGVGYIRLKSFTRNAAGEISQAWDELAEKQELKALVLDLRGNPGGLLNEAIKVSNLFIPKGKVVVETRGKLAQWNRTYRTPNQPKDADIPLAVLINHSSASASEIVAGTVQDYDRGVVLGERSFGKGLVQETRELPYGGKIKITIAKYYTPSGRLIQAIDYAQRDEEGRVKRIPDSLRSRFATENGREVFDGAGIAPDLEVKPPELAEAVAELYRGHHFFDYATQFRFTHDSIPPVKGYQLSDKTYQDFRSWLETRDFQFETNTDEALARLEKAAEADGYGAKMNESLESLEASLKRLKSDDLAENESRVRQLLGEEIASRYYYQGGKVAMGLRYDPQVDTALKVIQNSSRYHRILGFERP
ncbi:MAG: S41 family peptidase [Schleiferiaceae bacterium]|nr:S41 family peptidase [Schleiferiaceae bacterium]MDR9442077.1 S41 family peptidase [Schleiferiaceae bacterium]